LIKSGPPFLLVKTGVGGGRKPKKPGIRNKCARLYFFADIFEKPFMTVLTRCLPQAGTNHENVFRFS
jgi:hypothetical protein